MHIHSNIRILRKRAKVTQTELAEKLDKTQATIGDYERGKILPPLNIILQLCEIFAVDLQTIVFHDMETHGFDPAAPSSAAAENEQLRHQLRTQQQLTELQATHLQTLQREIREHAPGLAERLGLGE